MGVTILETEGLTVGRGGRPVLREVSLQVRRGERLALVGANGSGKTTLLRALAGIDPPLAGTIHWEGGPLPAGRARVGTLGVLFQSEPTHPFTVRELVTLGLGLERAPLAAERAAIERALQRLNVDSLAERSCSALSGGEAQRAALARALVAGPRLLLLDEPSNHLDPAHRAALAALLDGLRGDVAVVLATHDLDLAATADRVALLAGGKVVALGPPAEVLTPDSLRPALGVRIRRVDDPQGGRPFLRVEASA